MFTFVVALFLQSATPVVVPEQPELVIEDVRVEVLHDEGKVRLFLKARRPTDREIYLNVIKVPLDAGMYGRELEVVSFRDVKQGPQDPPVDPTSLYLVYENFDRDLAREGRISGGWFPQQMKRTTVRVEMGGPRLDVQRGVNFVVAHPNNADQDNNLDANWCARATNARFQRQ